MVCTGRPGSPGRPGKDREQARPGDLMLPGATLDALGVLLAVDAVLEAVHERLPARLYDVLADADGSPDALAVRGVYEDAGRGGCRAVLVEDADLVVGEVYLPELRVVGAYGLPERPVQRVHGAVSLGGGDHALALHEELYRGLRGRQAVCAFLRDDPERLQLEERGCLAGGAPDQER